LFIPGERYPCGEEKQASRFARQRRAKFFLRRLACWLLSLIMPIASDFGARER